LKSLDRSIDRSIDKSVDLGALGDDSASDPTQAPIIKFVEALLGEAFRSGASDVHVEPLSDRVQVRFRIDGKLEERDRIPLRMQRPLVARLMIMAGLDPGQLDLPQDGKANITVDGAPVPVDVSLVPTATPRRPSVVLRLERSPSDTSAASLRRLLAMQSAEGWFGWDRDRAGRQSDPVDAAVPRLGQDPTVWWKAVRAMTHLPPGAAAWDADRVARTGAVLVVLRTLHAADQRLWRRAEQKAARYLQDTMKCDARTAGDWLKRLEGSMKSPAPAVSPA